MKKIKIITDSNCGISQTEAKQLDIFVIPMSFLINGEEYLEEGIPHISMELYI